MSLMFVAAVHAQPPGRGQRPDPGARLETFITRMLQLDATQQNQLHTYLEESRVASQPPREQMPDLRKSLMAAIKANDSAQIDSLTTQIANLEQQLSAIRAKAAAKIYAILTEAQKAELGPGLGMLLNGGFGPMGRGPRGPGGPRPAPATPKQ